MTTDDQGRQPPTKPPDDRAREIAWAAATDAEHSRRAGNRCAWNKADYDVAASEYGGSTPRPNALYYPPEVPEK